MPAASAGEPLAPEDRALLQRLADRIVALRLETPAILTLESSRPVSLLAGQAMTFFEPVVQALFRFPEYRRFTALVERREAIESLATLIEEGAARREARRRG
jgi:hypothetical protein